ncbi:MAG TPA: hypothetical protein DEO93_13545 [Stenotrophomonas sp.]|jgi:hypothetical protein|nr:hypothetical protein [Stenotrophomonas sp.]
MFRILLLVAAVLSLTSCNSIYYNFHQEPFPAYGTAVDVSQTAVLSVMVTGAIPENGITRVDGVRTPIAKAGSPMWVRVAPGDHDFVVQHTEYIGTWSRWVDLELTVENMLPKHVYLVSIQNQGDRVTYETTDLGESPDYGIMLGKGKNRLYYKVAF